MPTYTFCCSCGHKQEVIRSMRDSNKPVFCVCGKQMRRDFRADVPAAGNREYARPIHSDSLAVMPSQRAEHERLHPDIKLDQQCRPVFESYQQHQKYLDRCGFIKQPQRRRKRGKKIK